MRKKSLAGCLFLAGLLFLQSATMAQSRLKVVVAGLNHDHIHNILHAFREGRVTIIGIAEPSKALQQKFAKAYHLPDSLFYSDLPSALAAHQHPDAVLGYNEVGRHVDVVRICAPRGIPVMVEKPLAATLAQANEIQALAGKYHVKVLTNYETTWYASFHALYQDLQADSIGPLKKLVVHDGHQGPKEIGCSDAFLSWLTDPVLNGAGALNDFGCYGADLMTWFMQGKKPVAVTAVTRHYKPAVYPKVDDDATILVEYPTCTGLLEGSWNWPFSIKDMELFGTTGYLHAMDGTHIYKRQRENKVSAYDAPALPAPINDPMEYLAAVLQGKISGDNDLSSLQYNMVVMQILDAAKRSAASGKRIVL